ncbi:MAG: hypothetical protein J6T35_02205 [Bacteroidales bacterium]|nr:hypothetical protein [Bacteroidales bacterium]
MNTIETIRAEIERLDKHYIVCEEYDCGWNNALNAISKFLDTLPEQPASEGLEEEARKYLTKNFTPPGDRESLPIEDAAYTLWFDDVCHLARHFAEWGANHASGKAPKVDLDGKVTFDCISKKVTMTIRELINYYIDTECCNVAEECGF